MSTSQRFANNNNHHSYNNNNMMEQTKNVNPLCDNNNHNNSFSGMTHNDNGLRAASHVSMEHTVNAHEYNPTCSCDDCQGLLNHYTQYEILDAFVSQHLRFEANVQSTFGFIPCIGGPHGNAATKSVPTGKFVVDKRTGEKVEERQMVVEHSNMYLFHMHLHHMKPVPKDYRERSYARFFAPAAVEQQQQNHHYNNNNNNNNNYVSVPAPHSSYNNNNFKKFNNNNQQQQSFATHQNVYQGRKQQYNNNNMNNNNNNNYYYNNTNNNNFNYTANDVEHAQQNVQFSGVARLGN